MNYSIGENIDSWCMSCKLMLAHTIEVILDENIKKVHCNTCNRIHKYHSNPPKKNKIVKKKLSKISGLKSLDFKNLIKDHDSNDVKNYSMEKPFIKGDLLKHKNFGLGYVIANKNSHKIEVLFEIGHKILIHSRI